MKRRALAEQFLERLQSRTGWAPAHEQERRLIANWLEELVARSAARWPSLGVAREDFVLHVADRVAVDGDVFETLRGIRGPDLYLACGGALAAPGALTALIERIRRTCERVLANEPDTCREDVCEKLTSLLLANEKERPALIGRYTGRGELDGYLAVACIHVAHNTRHSRRREILSPRVTLEAVADLELEFIKQRCGEHFTAAFKEALSSLTPRDRNVLRMNVVEGLNIERIGASYDVHRATVARWLVGIREQLVTSTRAALATKLALTNSEVDSLLRVVRSQLDVSVRGLLI